MIRRAIWIELFQKKDRVITPEGIGTIMEDEVLNFDALHYAYSTVKVQHTEGYSANPENEIVDVDRWQPSLITEEEFINHKS